MLTLACIQTDKGPRTLALRDLDPMAWAAISDQAIAIYNAPDDPGARYDRINRRMVAA